MVRGDADTIGWDREPVGYDRPRRRRAKARGATIAVLYAVGMLSATILGSALVMGALLGHAGGWVAIAIAAAFPVGGLVFAITLSSLDHGPRPPARRSHRPASPPSGRAQR